MQVPRMIMCAPSVKFPWIRRLCHERLIPKSSRPLPQSKVWAQATIGVRNKSQMTCSQALDKIGFYGLGSTMMSKIWYDGDALAGVLVPAGALAITDECFDGFGGVTRRIGKWRYSSPNSVRNARHLGRGTMTWTARILCLIIYSLPRYSCHPLAGRVALITVDSDALSKIHTQNGC